MLEEAEKRDHRKLGREMDLFHFEPEYAPGAVFWHDKGYKIYRKLIEYMRNRQEHNGYIEIATPRIMDRVLWEISGHWDKYGAHNYSGKTEDEKQFCVKPMNCPGGLLVYKQGIKSYRDLPLRVAEFGMGQPLRGFRFADGTDARPRVYAGRCAYFLHAGTDGRRMRQDY